MRTALQTPIGPIDLTWTIEGHEERSLGRVTPVRGGTVQEWPGDDVDVRLVVARFDPRVLPEMAASLDDTVAAVWTLRPRRDIGASSFRALLSAPGVEDHTGGDGGQHLAARTYERDGFRLTIGTHWDDALAARAGLDGGARPGPALPASWARLLDPFARRPVLLPSGEKAFGAWDEPRGVGVHFPPAPAGSTVDVHVAIAWGHVRDADGEDATRFAADTSPDDVLDQALDG